jgi:hypothetical protein
MRNALETMLADEAVRGVSLAGLGLIKHTNRLNVLDFRKKGEAESCIFL